MDNLRHRYLLSLPDLPLWVETRDLLLWEGSKVIENPTQSGFVVWRMEDGIGSVVGEPEPQAVALAARDVPELLAFEDNIERLRSHLPAFQAETATIFTEPELLPYVPAHRSCEISLDEISVQSHLPADPLAELSNVAEDGVTIVAAFDGSHPVAFAYVASETETLWDVSIDTIRSHRREWAPCDSGGMNAQSIQ